MLQTEDQTKYAGLNELLLIEETMPKYNAYITKLFVKELFKRKKMLVADFGSGIGTLSMIYKNLTGTSPYCIEIDPINQTYMKKRGFDVQNKIEDFKFKFDGIFSSNVLEHIEDDLTALINCHNNLNDSGKLILFLPAFNFLFSRLDTSVGHYRRYQKNDIINKCERAGFQIETIFFVDSIGFFGSLFLKYLGQDKSGSMCSTGPLNFYDKLIFPVSKFFDNIGLKFLFGKNIFVVASKQNNN